MREQLITHITSVLAKEKKFDWNCHWVLYRGTSSVLHKCDAMPMKGKNLESGDYVLQPTQSLLQKWMREEKGITLFVGIDSVEKEFKCWSHETKGEGWLTTPLVATYFHKTYEEALEKGLQEALKLIKL